MDKDTAVSGGGVLLAGVSSAPLDDQGRVAIDLDCVGCGYNLRMCDAQGRCPECGLAVGRSSVGRYLCYHEPKWVQCLAWGMNRFAVALVAGVVGGGVVYFTGVSFDLFYQLSPVVEVFYLLALFLLCAAVPFALLGLIRSTRKEQSPVTPERLLSARRITRTCLVLGCLTPLLASATESFGSAGYDGGVHWTTSTLILFASMMWLVVPIGLLVHTRKLAKMIPRPKLANWTLAVLIMIGLSGLFVVGLSDNWFGWYDAVVPYFNKIWPSSGGASSGPWVFPSWYPGASWYVHERFVATLEWAQTGARIGLGVGVLGIVPLFFVYWSALHQEAAKAKATWAASPWQKKEVAAAAEHAPSA